MGGIDSVQNHVISVIYWRLDELGFWGLGGPELSRRLKGVERELGWMDGGWMGDWIDGIGRKIGLARMVVEWAELVSTFVCVYHRFTKRRVS